MLVLLFVLTILFFISVISTLNYNTSIYINNKLIELCSTLFSLLLLLLIISPTIIILLDSDITIIPTYIIYSLGLQWAWQFNLVFLSLHSHFIGSEKRVVGFESYRDHYIISTKVMSTINMHYFSVDWYSYIRESI